MRKIEKQMIDAILGVRHFKKSNTTVSPFWVGHPGGLSIAGLHLYLFTTSIAYFPCFDGKLAGYFVTNPREWRTSTTKSRLNAVFSQFASRCRLESRYGEWYLDGQHWPKHSKLAALFDTHQHDTHAISRLNGMADSLSRPPLNVPVSMLSNAIPVGPMTMAEIARTPRPSYPAVSTSWPPSFQHGLCVLGPVTPR
jgi:hypothetical protein